MLGNFDGTFMREPRNVFAQRKTDSHILKHWKNHHHGKGEPVFKIRVIKYCRDALTRHVQEVVMIEYRGLVLDSKPGYNRSVLSRLVLEDSKDSDMKGQSGVMNGHTDILKDDREIILQKMRLPQGWKTGEDI